MSDASEADRLEQAQEVDAVADEEPRIDLDRSAADAIEQAQVVPEDPDPAM